MALTNIVFPTQTYGLFFNKRSSGNIGTIANILFSDEIMVNLTLTSTGFRTFTF